MEYILFIILILFCIYLFYQIKKKDKITSEIKLNESINQLNKISQ